jgi:glycogen debranching enzyme
VSAVRQPFLHDQVILVSAPTMAICLPSGQLDGTGAGGLFTADRRVLSVLRVEVDGHEPEPIHAELDGANAARFVAGLRHVDAPTPDLVLRLERRRKIADRPTGQVLTETLTLTNSGQAELTSRVTVELGCDFADVFSVKDGDARPVACIVSAATDGLTFAALEVPGWSVTVRATPAPAEIAATTLAFHVHLPAGSRSAIVLTVIPTVPADASVVATAPRRLRAGAPKVHTHDGVLGPLLARSIDDLDHLALSDPLQPADEFFAAGAPWYLTMFGRDALWAAEFALPLGIGRAASTLRVLARRQATTRDPSIAAEPGKILHEVRPPALAHDTGFRLPPVYYGSIDSTPLWIRLLHRAWRWGMPAGEVRDLLPNLRAAVGWLLTEADADGDGLVEYIDASGQGLVNQGWKDSSDSVQHLGGSLAEAPIALCEVQGYAYAAALAAAELYDAFGVPDGTDGTDGSGGAGSAADLRAWAAHLAAAFHEKFWIEDERGRYLAIALDGEKRPVASITSNPGHLLTSGLLTPEQIAHVATRLAGTELASGFGLRTMSDRSVGYNPFGYHTGSVWTHDTAVVIGELAASGRVDEAWTLVRGLLAAAPVFAHRMPELFSGEARTQVVAPGPYPASCRPQAWAAGAAVAVVTALLGLRPDVPAGRLVLAPCGLAQGRLDGFAVDGLSVAGGRLSVRVHGTTLEVLEAPAGLEVVILG